MSENLSELRHSAAHLLAAAVLEIWPNAKPAIGPSIDNGFYYDIDFGDVKISDTDLKQIQKKMKKMVNKWDSFEQFKVSPAEASKEFDSNPYKLEMIQQLADDGEDITIYQSGSFRDLCRGGHINSPKEELKHFKLLSVAGAYWRGDEKNKMLTRIYGTAFFTKEELDSHLEMLAEAKKRDHRKIGREQDLFTFSQLIGPGLPLWTPRGTIMRNLLDDFVWDLRRKRGYQKVEIPHITKKELYETSGHWEKYEDDLFRIDSREKKGYALKPMNCPHHTQIFARKPHSYKELPQRYSNTTMVYRDEQSGELSGLSRVEAITQDDAHVFCRKDQIKSEMMKIWDIIDEFYSAVGFKLQVRISLSDPEHPENYLGSKEEWKESEKILRELVQERGVEAVEQEGEAAFYGPKLDFMAYDSLGREWQVATNQLDMNMPKRFDLTCVNEHGEKEGIYMLHAAIMGSIERYLSILIEHFAGAFPVWLSPVQAVIIPIGEDHAVYAKLVQERLQEVGVRVELWQQSESMQKKIRVAEKKKIPCMLIIGDKEVKDETVAVRHRGQINAGTNSISEFVDHIQQIITTKALEL